MKSISHDSASDNLGSLDDTLRLIAHLPVPEGLVERVQAGLHASSAIKRYSGRVLAWPVSVSFQNGWMRAAAAAAIVFVVAGGGWGVYSRIQPAAPARGAIVPPHAGSSGGFSSAGAMRTPQTLNGPVLTHPAIPAPQPAGLAAKPTVQTTPTPAHRAKAKSTGKAAVQTAPAAK